MEIEDPLVALEEVVARSWRVPLTTRVVVDADALAGALEGVRAAAAAGPAADFDGYLRDIADALDDLRGEAADGGPGALPVTAAATAELRPILAAAETSAQQLREQARADAERVREEAEREAERLRASAAADAAEQLRQAERAAARVDELTDAAAVDMQSMIAGLRDRGVAVGERLGSVLAELEEIGGGSATARRTDDGQAREATEASYEIHVVEPHGRPAMERDVPPGIERDVPPVVEPHDPPEFEPRFARAPEEQLPAEELHAAGDHTPGERSV